MNFDISPHPLVLVIPGITSIHPRIPSASDITDDQCSICSDLVTMVARECFSSCNYGMEQKIIKRIILYKIEDFQLIKSKVKDFQLIKSIIEDSQLFCYH